MFFEFSKSALEYYTLQFTIYEFPRDVSANDTFSRTTDRWSHVSPLFLMFTNTFLWYGGLSVEGSVHVFCAFIII